MSASSRQSGDPAIDSRERVLALAKIIGNQSRLLAVRVPRGESARAVVAVVLIGLVVTAVVAQTGGNWWWWIAAAPTPYLLVLLFQFVLDAPPADRERALARILARRRLWDAADPEVLRGVFRVLVDRGLKWPLRVDPERVAALVAVRRARFQSRKAARSTAVPDTNAT